MRSNKWPSKKTILDMVIDMYAGEMGHQDGIEKRACFGRLGIYKMDLATLRRFWLETNNATAEEMGYE